MAPTPQRPALLVIVGQTASGKSVLAYKIAKEFNGEIISADSRTIYKELDIGTAKPSVKEQADVRHWGIDLVAPDEDFNVAQFKKYAEDRIADITNRGKLPVLVGGSGLYVDAVLFDYQFSSVNAERDEQNPRHLKKSVSNPKDKIIRLGVLIIGLQIPQEELRKRVTNRVESMIKDGFIDEVKQVSAQYGWNAKALLSPGYRAFRGYAEGRESLEEATQKFIDNDLSLAKRQRTWFKRNKNIQWFSSISDAYQALSKLLSN